MAGLPAAALLAAGAVTASAAPQRTVWLCKPGLADNPCAPDLETAELGPGGSTSETEQDFGGTPPVDCFYVYPTVSAQQTINADRSIESAQRSVARLQASRFGAGCRIWAPVYRQVTLRGLFSGGFTFERLSIGYRDVRAAWRDYLRNHNRGRGVVLIGHSQGAGMLTRLVKFEVDRSRAQRRRLVSALLLGGEVAVRRGRDRGGDFQHMRACRSAGQTGCVIAYNSFLEAPPRITIFGRVANRYLKRPNPGELEVLCTNPAALRGGSGGLLLELPGEERWSRYRGLYEARCERRDGASWLQVTDIAGPADTRMRLTQGLGPGWGLHLYDVNLALGNLVAVVGRQARAYLNKRR